MLKHKRIISIVLAVLFLLALFFLRNTSLVKDVLNSEPNKEGLTYNTTIEALVGKDTDLDGVVDWEESLWGTDPNKAETTPGVSDSIAISQLKAEQKTSSPSSSPELEENLTETDKFSREFFSTTAALNQSGALDEATAEKLTSSLSERIQNTLPRKVYMLADIKVINDNTVKSIQNYNLKSGTLLYKKYPMNERIIMVLKESLTEDGEINMESLNKLDPIIKELKQIVAGLVKLSVPSKLSALHLDMINAFEKVVENLNDIKLIESDPIVAIGAISQYLKSNDQAELSVNKMAEEINKNN